MKLVESIIMNGNITPILPLLITVDDVVKRIRNDTYVVLASKYDTLSKINSRVRIEKDTLRYHDWLYIENELVYMTINASSVYNGEQVRLITADESSITIERDGRKNIITDMYLSNVDGIKVNDKIPLAMPSYLYTFHKSQGMEFDNVAICIDDLFEFPMLYTGITRARKNVVFFTLNSLLFRDIEKTIKLSRNEDAYIEFISVGGNRCKLNEYLHERINTGTIEITTINDMYKQ
jgi:exodeoxyribonuclease V alpha subunit